MSKSKHWSEYRQVVIETYEGASRGHHGSIRARPITGEYYPTTMVVECSKSMRTKHPVGSKFRIYAKEISRERSPTFLYTHFRWPYDVVE